jgi:hypothetical protein
VLMRGKCHAREGGDDSFKLVVPKKQMTIATGRSLITEPSVACELRR